jgi:hypothetical protein
MRAEASTLAAECKALDERYEKLKLAQKQLAYEDTVDEDRNRGLDAMKALKGRLDGLDEQIGETEQYSKTLVHMLRRSELARHSRLDDSSDVTAWRFEREILAEGGPVSGDPFVTREQWDAAIKFLSDNGLPLKTDREAAWATFTRIRTHYAAPACFLAERLFAPPAPWSGPRSPMRHFQFKTAWPQLATQAGFGLG